MPYPLDSEARPIFLISNMAMHTQNLEGDSRASLFIGQIVSDEDPLGAARATLVGRAGSEERNRIWPEQYVAWHQNS
jgi:putative heme iron utilization protein